MNANTICVFDIEKLHLEFHFIHKLLKTKAFVLTFWFFGFSGFLGCDINIIYCTCKMLNVLKYF